MFVDPGDRCPDRSNPFLDQSFPVAESRRRTSSSSHHHKFLEIRKMKGKIGTRVMNKLRLGGLEEGRTSRIGWMPANRTIHPLRARRLSSCPGRMGSSGQFLSSDITPSGILIQPGLSLTGSRY
jgi:hypothetical protein